MSLLAYYMPMESPITWWNIWRVNAMRIKSVCKKIPHFATTQDINYCQLLFAEIFE